MPAKFYSALAGLVLMLLFTCSPLSAQLDVEMLDDVTMAEDIRFTRTWPPTLLGPRLKNPNAAGRMLRRPRPTPAIPVTSGDVLRGPRYKNRRFELLPDRISTTPLPTRAPLYGPRYKNKR